MRQDKDHYPSNSHEKSKVRKSRVFNTNKTCLFHNIQTVKGEIFFRPFFLEGKQVFLVDTWAWF